MQRTLAWLTFTILAVLIGHALSLHSFGLSLYWPAGGVAAAWGLTLSDRGQLLGAAALVGLIQGLTLALLGLSMDAAAVFGVGNALVTVTFRLSMTWFARRAGRTAPAAGFGLVSPRDLLSVIGSATFAAAVTSPVGLAVTGLLGHEASVETLLAWLVRYVSAVVVVTLLWLAWVSRHDGRRRPRAAEVIAIVTLTVAVQLLIFRPDSQLPIGYVALIPVVLGGLRFPVLWSTVQGALVAGSAVAFHVLGSSGPFAVIADPVSGAMSLQGFASLAVVLGVGVSTTMGQLDRARRTAERIFEDSPSGMALVTAEGRALQVNAAMAELFELPVDRVRERTAPDLVDDFVGVQEHLARARAAEGEPCQETLVLQTYKGEVHLDVRSRCIQGMDDERDVVLSTVVDVTEQRRAEERLSFLADHDVLTGLFNRHRFEVELDRHRRISADAGSRGGVLLVDLDHFKDVNDSKGHGAGDDLIRAVAHVMEACLRSDDVLARVGGDEFAVLLPDGGRPAVERVASALVASVGDHCAAYDDVRQRVTASVGGTTFQAAEAAQIDAMALADLLMYDAKSEGRNAYVVADETGLTESGMVTRLEWKARIEKALETDAFELHLQPILDLHTGRIHGAEALLRLPTDDGIVLPGQFVPIAEQSGLASKLDAWVAARGIAMLADLRRWIPGLELELNVSGRSLGDEQVERAITESLRDHDVDPRALVLEITETSAVSDVAAARDFSRRISALGAKLALDDFGAGFASFYYLKHLAFDIIKIDGEFVRQVTESDIDMTILRSIVDLAVRLDKQTVAEFVKDAATLDVVTDAGVDFAQGYEIGRPCSYEEFIRRYASQAST